MGESHDLMNLGWVQTDIEQSLLQAQEALETYLDDAVLMHLQTSYDAIHQVSGSLQMAGVSGAVLLAEQVETLLMAMLDEQVEDRDEACQALAQALVYMPSYLNRIKNGEEDSPALLHTVVNDIRRVLNEEPIDELALFNPDFGEPRERASVAVKDLFDKVSQSDLRKLRQVYQFALIGLIRKEEIKVNTARLSNVLARLRQICQDAPINQLWEVATAFIESLLHDGTELNSASLGLLRSLEREIKEFIRAGVFALDRQAHPVVMKGLLYYVAKSSQTAPHIQSIRQAYDLGRYELGDAYGTKPRLLAGPDPETFKTVATVLSEELARIKDTIDLYVRNTDKSTVDLDGLLPSLNQIASTLVMLNLEAPRLVVQEQIDTLAGKIQAGAELSDALLLSTAEALLFIEAELESLAGNVKGVGQEGSTALVGAAAEVVINECLSSLRKAKDMIHGFLADNENFSLLDRVPNTLRSAYGGLAMLSQSATAQLVLSISQYVEDDILAQQRAPDDEAIEALAEVIASVEFCLEGVSIQQPANRAVLERAKVQIAKLGYPVEQTDGISSEEVGLDSYATEFDQSVDSFDASEWHETSADQKADETSDSDVQGNSFELDDEQRESEQHTAETIVDDYVKEVVTESAASLETIEFELLDNDWMASDNESEIVSDAEQVDTELMPAVGVAEAEQFETEAEAEPLEVEDDDDLIDEEILEIFIEEAQEVFEEIDRHWPTYVADNSNIEALKEVRRAFHTLKGSGRMVKANIISELAWSIENMLNLLIEGEVSPSVSVANLVNDVRPALPTLLSHFQLQTPPDIDVQPWVECAVALAAGEVLSGAPEQVSGSGEPQPEDVDDNELSAELDEESFAEQASLVDQELPVYEEPRIYKETFDTSEEALSEAANPGSTFEDEEPDTVLYELFVKESEQHLTTLQDFINQVDLAGEPVMISDGLYRALHTLKGSAKMAALDVFAGIAEPTEGLSIALINAEQPVDAPVLQALRTAHDMMAHAASHLPENPQLELEDSDVFVEQLQRLTESFSQQVEETEEPTLSVGQGFIRDHIDRICNLIDGYEEWRQQPQADSAAVAVMQADAEALHRVAMAVDMPPLQSLLAGIQAALARIATQQVPLGAVVLDALDAANNGLVGFFDQVAASETVSDTTALVNRLEAGLQPVDEVLEGSVQVIDDVPAMVVSAPLESASEEEPDAELIEIFLEEADEILEQASAAKQRWIEDSTDSLALDELQRCLHTLKGGARMAGIMAVGDVSHELESVYEFVSEGKLGLTPALYDTVHACDDRIMDMLGELKMQLRCSSADDLINRVQHYRETGGLQPDEAAGAEALLQQLTAQVKASSQADIDSGQLLADMRSSLEAFQNVAYQSSLHEAGDLCLIFGEVLAAIEAQELPQEATQTELADWLERLNTSYNESKQTDTIDAGPSAAITSETAIDQPSARKPSQDNVRVSAALLEQLVDLAGETSVSRSRVEQQVNNYGYSIEEVGSTIERLREQLRRLENETEIQILFRQEREGPTHEGFDPLEMDRYSRMQELSRALMESVSDLLDLKETLKDQVRITENLLLQQSRTNTELHEGLMKARMVPFSRVVPRLRRIVRQVSGELNKQVDLTFKNPETELDRSLLEHMTAPLEHMVRNALDHGIESADKRAAAGKSAVGKVALRLNRDGGDIVLELEDDGAGIDIERVRAKAIERGLMGADAKLTDHEVLQFILQQGFSTAEQVTQISGRGVGMDVVYSEIRQLGGSISIGSEVGQGTCFTVRLPFTVSISRALMVNVGEDEFALPLSSIEGVVRINPYELEEYFKEDGPDFEYAGVNYDLHYLGDFVGRPHGAQMQGGVLPLPVILVRTSEHAIAVQVDSISGSREVVVKPLGPQLSKVPGMSGATILGDGRVVLILDMAGMIREHLAKEGIEHESDVLTSASVSDHLRVMVVDDSVTVRKVASRLLERNGMEVILAKDGVEAMTKLQEVVPSIMLLDIEMPRMDGFELASLMRHDDTLKHIPIIMISSRTGDKHQARAREIGVNQFMGKPFQESDLLAAISEFTDAEFETLEA